MGAGVSNWRLARAVASQGHIGVVSGTALDVILARRLQLGDPDGQMRLALAEFPDQSIAQKIIDRYFIEGGKQPDQPFLAKPMIGHNPSQAVEELLVASNFVEVFLAKQGHDGMVGINYLNKIQTPLLASIYGAMLADVDIIVVGAGIPIEIPKIIEGLIHNESVSQKLYVKDSASSHDHKMFFDPKKVLKDRPQLQRPLFFPIVSSATLAAMLVKKCKGQIDGLVIEGSSAGGHNAPPRGQTKYSQEGEPVYGPRDEIDLKAIASHEIPFWLAGSYASPDKLAKALAAGATGIQVGTIFAFCEESGLRDDIKREIILNCKTQQPRVFTDPVASPAGFPFKVLSVSDTLSDAAIYNRRDRLCDLGYLREAYELPNGSLSWRCPAEDQETFLRKGGNLEDTVGRKCICNGLMANIGLAQIQSDNAEELPLLTCGDDLSGILRVISAGEASYTARDVINFLLSNRGN